MSTNLLKNYLLNVEENVSNHIHNLYEQCKWKKHRPVYFACHLKSGQAYLVLQLFWNKWKAMSHNFDYMELCNYLANQFFCENEVLRIFVLGYCSFRNQVHMKIHSGNSANHLDQSQQKLIEVFRNLLDRLKLLIFKAFRVKYSFKNQTHAVY